MPWSPASNYTGRGSLGTHTGPFVDFDASQLTGANGSPVTVWPDAGGSGITLVTDRGTPTLTVGGRNGLNVVHFASATLMGKNPDHWRFLHREDHTVFVVNFIEGTNPNNNQNLLDTGGDVQTYRGYTISFEDRASRTPPRNNMLRVSIGRGGGGPDSPDAGLKYLSRIVPADNCYTPNAWHIAHTRLQAGHLELGADGALIATYNYNGSPASGSPFMPLRVGDNYDSLVTHLPVFPLNGSIAQIRIYDRALSDVEFAAEVAALSAKWNIA